MSSHSRPKHQQYAMKSEAKPKHVVLLDIDGDQFRTSQLLLQTVRPFVFESVRVLCCARTVRHDPDCVSS